MKSKKKESRAAMLFLAPNIIGFLVFTVGPVLYAVYLSLTEWNMVRSPVFTGLENFVKLFRDPRFYQALKNTMVYTVGTVPVLIVLSLLLAVLVNSKVKGISIFRTMIFIPVVASTVGSAMLWQWLLANDIGIVAYLLKIFGIKAPQFLTSSKWAMFSVILYTIWKQLGYNMVILLGGLQAIDITYYDAARVDGAGAVRRFFNITIPMLTPTLFFTVIMGVINSLQVFDQTHVLTKGGPNYATTTIVYYVYVEAFTNMKMGYACAASIILFLIILLITLFQWKGQERWVHYD
jgi:ABC-type sugar transport systems, permease components